LAPFLKLVQTKRRGPEAAIAIQFPTEERRQLIIFALVTKKIYLKIFTAKPGRPQIGSGTKIGKQNIL
jgi:hypothetical protein